jgi:hypothetical protein
MSNTASTGQPARGYAVLSPLGARVQQGGVLAPRLSSLRGKRVALVFDYAFRGDEMFASFQEAAQERFGDVTFLDPDKFGNFHGPAEEGRQAMERLAKSLELHEFDAAIVGVGA